MLATGTLVVVADGTSALLYRNSGHETVSLDLQETVTPHSLLNDGPAGSTPVEQSPQDRDEATFSKQLVHKLNAMALAHHLPDAVVVIADPSSLGHMRPLYHAELKRRIVRELHKTMVKSSPEDVAAALSKPCVSSL